MHGNVWEWCADTWHDNYKGATTEGSVWEGSGKQVVKPESKNLMQQWLAWQPPLLLYHYLWEFGGDDTYRMLRGGCWYNYPWYCRSAYRHRYGADFRCEYYGFRVAVSS